MNKQKSVTSKINNKNHGWKKEHGWTRKTHVHEETDGRV